MQPPQPTADVYRRQIQQHYASKAKTEADGTNSLSGWLMDTLVQWLWQWDTYGDQRRFNSRPE